MLVVLVALVRALLITRLCDISCRLNLSLTSYPWIIFKNYFGMYRDTTHSHIVWRWIKKSPELRRQCRPLIWVTGSHHLCRHLCLLGAAIQDAGIRSWSQDLNPDSYGIWVSSSREWTSFHSVNNLKCGYASTFILIINFFWHNVS